MDVLESVKYARVSDQQSKQLRNFGRDSFLMMKQSKMKKKDKPKGIKYQYMKR